MSAMTATAQTFFHQTDTTALDGESRPLLPRVRQRVLATYLARGLQTDEELWLFIRLYLGYAIPRHHVCPEHVAPFSFLADQFFERVGMVFGFANRAGGKTLQVAILNVVEALFKPGIEIVCAGAIEQQAVKGYEYVSSMLFGDPLLMRTLIRSLRSLTEFYNGSSIKITTGTYHGLNSPHPTKVRIDEIELMHWSILQEGLQMSLASRDQKWKAGDCLTSTRKFTNGTVQRLLDEKKDTIKTMSWCIWEILQPCCRQCHGDPEYGDCPAYSRLNKDGAEEEICGGRAHTLPPGGFFTIDDFVKKVGVLDKDTWEAQWLNKRPQAGALVYGNFFKDDPPYVVPTAEAEELLRRAREERWLRVVGMDFGANFYAGYFMRDPHTEIWYQYHEYWYSAERDLPLPQHGRNIIRADPLGWSADIFVYGDPSARQAIRDLEYFILTAADGTPDEYSLIVAPANNNVYSGVNLVKQLLTRRPHDLLPRLRFFHSCVRMREELGRLYVHRTNKDGTTNRDVIVKAQDHASDSLRYAMLSFETFGTTTVMNSRQIKGLW